MYTFLIIFHVIAAFVLIGVILLQAGRGGGLADSLGGSQLQSMFGTKSATVLTRLTTVCAIVFLFTCLSLAILSSHKARSIVDKADIPKAMPASIPAMPDAPEIAPVVTSEFEPEPELMSVEEPITSDVSQETLFPEPLEPVEAEVN